MGKNCTKYNNIAESAKLGVGTSQCTPYSIMKHWLLLPTMMNGNGRGWEGEKEFILLCGLGTTFLISLILYYIFCGQSQSAEDVWSTTSNIILMSKRKQKLGSTPVCT